MPGETLRILQPQHHKAKVCVWADLEIGQVEFIMSANGPQEIKLILAQTMKLMDFRDNMSSAILLDLYFYSVQFALHNKFNKEQLSAFFSIVKKTHEVCCETPYGNIEQCYEYFKELVLCHAVKRPPWSVNQFSPNQVKLITDYVLNTYFRHMKLYKYVFTPMLRLDLSVTYVGMTETPSTTEVAKDEIVDKPEEDTKQPDIQQQTEEEYRVEELLEDESEAQKELRKLITLQLNGEIEKLRSSLNQQIQLNNDTLQKKISVVDGGVMGKTSRTSTSKSKRK